MREEEEGEPISRGIDRGRLGNHILLRNGMDIHKEGSDQATDRERERERER